MDNVPGLTILTSLRELLSIRGYPGHIEDGSICIGKPKGPLVMVSAACIFDKEFRVRCVQLLHPNGETEKYTIKLNGASGCELEEYGYTPTQGHHGHVFSNGRKIANLHIPNTGDLSEIADAIAQRIKRELSS